MASRAALALLFALGPTGCSRCSSAEAQAPVRVAAAATLTFAFEELGEMYEAETGYAVVFSFGSTGQLAAQLRQGAPYDVFAAANVSFVDQVVAAGACDGDTRAPYARGRIAVWARKAGVALPAKFSDLGDARFQRIAIANPEHAPYGLAAQQALQAAGIWDQVRPRLVLGENVRQTFQYAASGNVDVAIVALALVVQDQENPWSLVEEDLHRPIDQALVVCTHGAQRKGGEAFVRYVNSTAGRAVMRRYGFLLPSEGRVSP